MRTVTFSVVGLLLLGCVTTPETGRRAFVVTSEKEEAALGNQAYQQVLAKEKVSSNEKWTAVLHRVGKRIAGAANKPDYQWQFTLIDSSQANAFALPGGKVAFYTGIFPYAQNEAGIATVMGHEVAHATARHGGQRIALEIGTQLTFTGIMLALGKKEDRSKGLILAALGLGSQVGVALPFSRANESEADEIGLIYMARAGYDPHEAPKFWERFGKQGGGPPEFLSTHPKSENRMRALQRQVPQVLSLYQTSPQYGAGEKL